ncbi:hypothetical protein CBL_10178 [Carabus blaptoides fortunei]
MSTSSSNSYNSSTCTCVLSYTSSSTSTSEYKQYYFHPQSHPDIQSKIASFWKYLEQANISVPESNVSRFDKRSDEHLKEFKVKLKSNKDVKMKSTANKWCHLLRLLSKRGLDKLAMSSKPKTCRFCKHESFRPTFADEDCYDMLVEIEKSDDDKLAGFDDVANKLRDIEAYLKSMYCEQNKVNEATEDDTRVPLAKTETTSDEVDELSSKYNLKSASRMNVDKTEETDQKATETRVVLSRRELEGTSYINADQMKEILNIHDIAEYVRLSHAIINEIQEEEAENIDTATTIRIMMKIISENITIKKRKMK